MLSIATKRSDHRRTTRDPKELSTGLPDPVETLREFLAERERTRTFAPGEFAKVRITIGLSAPEASVFE